MEKEQPKKVYKEIDDMYDDTTILKEILRELRAIRKNTKSTELELRIIQLQLKNKGNFPI